MLRVAGTPDNPTPGIPPEFLRAPVLAPPDAEDELPAPPVVEPGMSGRRARLLPADFEKHGFTPGCAACTAIELDGRTRKGHNPVCRVRMEAALSAKPEGRERIDMGYGRVATAAL